MSMTLAELESRLNHMTDADLKRNAMDGYREYFKKFHEERERAEKADNWNKFLTTDRDYWMDACRKAVDRLEKAEAEVEELKKLSSHGNGEVLLGWMDAHRKAMDKLAEAEARTKAFEQWAQCMVDVLTDLELHEESDKALKMNPKDARNINALIHNVPWHNPSASTQSPTDDTLKAH
jgi:predicted S18 family serine protease